MLPCRIMQLIRLQPYQLHSLSLGPHHIIVVAAHVVAHVVGIVGIFVIVVVWGSRALV